MWDRRRFVLASLLLLLAAAAHARPQLPSSLPQVDVDAAVVGSQEEVEEVVGDEKADYVDDDTALEDENTGQEDEEYPEG